MPQDSLILLHFSTAGRSFSRTGMSLSFLPFSLPSSNAPQHRRPPEGSIYGLAFSAYEVLLRDRADGCGWACSLLRDDRHLPPPAFVGFPRK